MSFIWPWMLLSLLLVPLLVSVYLWLLRRQRRAAVNLGPLGLVQNRSGAQPGRRRHIPPALFLAGLAALLLGLARPQMAVSLPRTEGTAILAIDVSSSMNADDLEPTRMEAAKVAARTFVENQPRTVLIGVVAFSSGGLVVQPPTDDRAAILSTLDRLSPEGGTSLGQGIFSSLSAIAGEALAIDAAALEKAALDETALAQIPLQEALDDGAGQIGYYPSAVVVLLSDGENTSPPEPLDVAQLAAEAGVRIYPVGIGSPEGSVVEVEGFSILTQLQEAPLQDIASVTNGRYYNARDAASLEEIYNTIDLQLTLRGEMMEITSIVAGIGLLLFMAGGALSLFWFGRVP